MIHRNSTTILTGIYITIKALIENATVPTPPPPAPKKTSGTTTTTPSTGQPRLSSLLRRLFADGDGGSGGAKPNDPPPTPTPANTDVPSRVHDIIIDVDWDSVAWNGSVPENYTAFAITVEFALEPYVEPAFWDSENGWLYAAIIGIAVSIILWIGATMLRRCCGRNTSGYTRGSGTGGKRNGGTAADGLPIDGVGSSSGSLNLNNMRTDDL